MLDVCACLWGFFAHEGSALLGTVFSIPLMFPAQEIEQGKWRQDLCSIIP